MNFFIVFDGFHEARKLMTEVLEICKLRNIFLVKLRSESFKILKVYVVEIFKILKVYVVGIFVVFLAVHRSQKSFPKRAPILIPGAKSASTKRT